MLQPRAQRYAHVSGIYAAWPDARPDRRHARFYAPLRSPLLAMRRSVRFGVCSACSNGNSAGYPKRPCPTVDGLAVPFCWRRQAHGENPGIIIFMVRGAAKAAWQLLNKDFHGLLPSEFVIFRFQRRIAVKSGPLRGLRKPVPASRARRGSFVPLVSGRLASSAVVRDLSTPFALLTSFKMTEKRG